MKVFTPFRVDAADQSLWRDGQRVPLTPKVFAVLEYLVNRAGRLVVQSEPLEALWRGTLVQPEVLKSQILDVRAALGDRPEDPIYVDTVHRRGYRFIAEVFDAAPPLQRDDHSVAVLPFASMSSDPEISPTAPPRLSLTFSPMCRASAFCFENSPNDVREIGSPSRSFSARSRGWARKATMQSQSP
jgi:DNA-binding winged helix-turn-helix (wHTH) protein